MRNVLSFEVAESDDGIVTVTPCVDGKSLSATVTAFEHAQGYQDPAGGYGGLVPAFYRYGPLGPYFLGRAENRATGAEPRRIYLLGCECGEVGCWPLTATVDVDDDTVRWVDLRQPYRPNRSYEAFGPFVFEREAYEQALADLGPLEDND